jgi:hypothetical protein
VFDFFTSSVFEQIMPLLVIPSLILCILGPIRFYREVRGSKRHLAFIGPVFWVAGMLVVPAILGLFVGTRILPMSRDTVVLIRAEQTLALALSIVVGAVLLRWRP